MYSLNILKTFCITSLGSLTFIKKRQLWMNCWIAPRIIGLSKIIRQKIENKNKLIAEHMIHVIAKELSHSVPHSRGDASLGLQERACTCWGEFLFVYTLRLFCTQSGSIISTIFLCKKKKSFFVFHLVFYLYFIKVVMFGTHFFFFHLS